jgi:arginase
VSRLRARCPGCHTLTAVAVGDEYECHSCGEQYDAGLVRVPAAWGKGGELMAQAAAIALPYPEVAVIEAPTLAEQSLAVAGALPARPIVLGGCCCAHIGAVEALAASHERLGVVWFDAHGDLNTPESSPSGNLWGMPLRMLLDAGTVAVGDSALVGARCLDPPEEAYISAAGLPTGPDGIERALEGVDAVYVAFDADVLGPAEGIPVWLPEPGGLSVAAAERLLRGIAELCPVAGVGFTGLAPSEDVSALSRLAGALGLSR